MHANLMTESTAASGNIWKRPGRLHDIYEPALFTCWKLGRCSRGDSIRCLWPSKHWKTAAGRLKIYAKPWLALRIKYRHKRLEVDFNVYVNKDLKDDIKFLYAWICVSTSLFLFKPFACKYIADTNWRNSSHLADLGQEIQDTWMRTYLASWNL